MNLPELRESEPHKETELEDEVEGEPVGDAEGGFNDGEEGKDHPVPVIAVSLVRKGLLIESGEGHRGTYVSHCVSSALEVVKRALRE